MDGVINTILSQAGFAGALLIATSIFAWKILDKNQALNEKLQSTAKDYADALAAKDQNYQQSLSQLFEEYSRQLQDIQNKRTEDAQKVANTLLEQQEKFLQAVQQLNLATVELKAIMTETRQDVRRRRSTPGFPRPDGGSNG